MVSYIAAQKGYGSRDCGNQITCGCHWKGIGFLKPATLSGGGLIRFFFLLSFFFSIHRLDKREGPKKKEVQIYCINLQKEIGCLSGQLYIRVQGFP